MDRRALSALAALTVGLNAVPLLGRSSARTAASILLVLVPLTTVDLWLSLLPTSWPHFSILPALLLPVERNVALRIPPGSRRVPGRR